MSEYLTEGIEKVIPFLAQTCDELIRQELIRALTLKTQEWCEGDPELADIILEDKKSLEGCIKHVLEQAATHIAKVVSAMPDDERKMLPTKKIAGRDASMMGGAVGEEKVYEWARDYYYKVKEAAPVASKKDDKDKKGKTNAKNSTKGKGKDQKADSGAESKTGDAQAPAQVEAGPPEQMTLGGMKTAA